MNLKVKSILMWAFAILVVIFLARPYIERVLNKADILDHQEYLVEFIDDSGNRVKMNRHAKRIISLYSAHTENLYSLGLESEIIGIGTSDAYPVNIVEKKVYDYKSDPEKIIAARPDLVLIRPFINRKVPDFVNALKSAGINVVSLYPEKYEDFPEYIRNMAMMTGKTKTAEILLDEFNQEIEAIRNSTKDIDEKVNVYFESTETEYKTVTADSMPALAIEIAGGLNVAQGAEPVQKGSSIAAFGIERILENAENIDVYISQRGVMNSGGNYHSIVIRPGFKAIKAVKNERVYEINQKLISSPSFRYAKGLKEMRRMFYPEMFDAYDHLSSEEPLTRETLAELLVRYKHREIFVPSSKYYQGNITGHKYGYFTDIPVEHPNFDFIETAVLAGFLDGSFDEETQTEYFDPERVITRDELAVSVYLMKDFVEVEKKAEILDIDRIKNPRIVQKLVDLDVFQLSEGKFEGEKIVTVDECINILNNLK